LQPEVITVGEGLKPIKSARVCGQTGKNSKKKARRGKTMFPRTKKRVGYKMNISVIGRSNFGGGKLDPRAEDRKRRG